MDIGADIYGTDRIEVLRNGSGLVVSSDNQVLKQFKFGQTEIKQDIGQMEVGLQNGR